MDDLAAYQKSFDKSCADNLPLDSDELYCNSDDAMWIGDADADLQFRL